MSGHVSTEGAVTPQMTTNAHATGRRAVKAVIPAAGLATRFLPATKAVPKELLPVVDRPVLQYIVEEAVTAALDISDGLAGEAGHLVTSTGFVASSRMTAREGGT